MNQKWINIKYAGRTQMSEYLGGGGTKIMF